MLPARRVALVAGARTPTRRALPVVGVTAVLSGSAASRVRQGAAPAPRGGDRAPRKPEHRTGANGSRKGRLSDPAEERTPGDPIIRGFADVAHIDDPLLRHN